MKVLLEDRSGSSPRNIFVKRRAALVMLPKDNFMKFILLPVLLSAGTTEMARRGATSTLMRIPRFMRVRS